MSEEDFTNEYFAGREVGNIAFIAITYYLSTQNQGGNNSKSDVPTTNKADFYVAPSGTVFTQQQFNYMIQNNISIMQMEAMVSSGNTNKISNDITELSRVDSALKTDVYHNFPDIIDNYAGMAQKTAISNGILYQLEGSYNGTIGRFEWIIQDNTVTHRMFVPNGTINGRPIIP